MLLLHFLLRLLLVILKIHDGFLGKFQITLQLPLGSLKVHTQLLLLLQRTLKLKIEKRFLIFTSMWKQLCPLVWTVQVTLKTYIIHLLLKLGLGLGQSVDFVFLSLQVIKSLLMSLLKSFLFLGELSNALILRGHLLSQVLHLNLQEICCYCMIIC